MGNTLIGAIIGGVIAGLLASNGDGHLGFWAFIVWVITMAGTNGGILRVLASIIFVVVAALTIVIHKQFF